MDNKKRIKLVAIILLVAFSVIAFAVPFKMNAVFWISYLFGIVSIVAQLFVLKLAFEGQEDVRSKLYGFPIAQVGIIYMLAQLIVSLIFMAIATFAPAWSAILVDVLILAVAALGLIGTDVAREQVHQQEIKAEADTGQMMNMRVIVESLVGQCSDPEVKKAMEALAEEFRYSDPVSNEATKELEADLEEQIIILKNSVESKDSETVNSVCNQMAVLLTKRNQICKYNKNN